MTDSFDPRYSIPAWRERYGTPFGDDGIADLVHGEPGARHALAAAQRSDCKAKVLIPPRGDAVTPTAARASRAGFGGRDGSS